MTRLAGWTVLLCSTSMHIRPWTTTVLNTTHIAHRTSQTAHHINFPPAVEYTFAFRHQRFCASSKIKSQLESPSQLLLRMMTRTHSNLLASSTNFYFASVASNSFVYTRVDNDENHIIESFYRCCHSQPKDLVL